MAALMRTSVFLVVYSVLIPDTIKYKRFLSEGSAILERYDGV